MRRSIRDYFEYGNIVPATLVGTALIAILGIATLGIFPNDNQAVADMRIEPAAGTLVTGDSFTISVIVESQVPVNVFAGEMQFNADVLSVSAIDYNTSIAQLWAELPWFSNGAGTIHFAGGTTQPGGFVGVGDLITVTFTATQPGRGELSLKNARILQHDGLGTDVELGESIDSILTVQENISNNSVLSQSNLGSDIAVIDKTPTTDLNGDGQQTVADLSIFMSDLLSQNKRSDFNQDGKINTADLSIIMQIQ